MPGMPNLYPSTLQNLLVGLQGGLDPADAYGMLNDAMAQQEQRQSYLHQLREEREAEQEARRQARQQTFASLGGAVFEGAAGGMTPEAVQSQLEFLTAATPGVGPRMEGRLEDLVDQAYPRAPSQSIQGLAPSVAVKGGLEEIEQANQARGRFTGPRPQTSPMYVPEAPAATDAVNLVDVMVPGGADAMGKPIESSLGPAVATAAREDKISGMDLQQSILSQQQDALTLGVTDPAILEAIAQQITLLWSTLPEPQGERGQPGTTGRTGSRPPTAPRSPMFPGLVGAFDDLYGG